MKIAVYHNPEKGYERQLASALRAGLTGKVELITGKDFRPGFDLVCVIGIKSRRLTFELEKLGAPYLYFDKGYNRQWSANRPRWWRVSINDHQPTGFIRRLDVPRDRALAQGWNPKPWRKAGSFILYAGMSGKSHAFYGIDDPHKFGIDLVAAIRKHSDREIIYRPKPAWRDAKYIEGAKFLYGAHHGIEKDLTGAHAMVTHSSAACFEAVLCGVPAIVLGNGVMAPICSRQIDEIEQPYLASERERWQMLAALGYLQWSLGEIRDGTMWRSVEGMIGIADGL